MNRIKEIVLIGVLFLLYMQVLAQVSYGGYPRCIHSREKESIGIIQLKSLPTDQYLQEDADGVENASPMRTGIVRQVYFSNREDGYYDTLTNGDRIWRLAIQSTGASFITLYFSQYKIPQGAELFIYDLSGRYILGKFTSNNELNGNEFYTQAIPGDVVIIEYYEPVLVRGKGIIEINEIGHGYKEMFYANSYEEKGPYGNSTISCRHIDVACNIGDAWKDQIRSVVHYQMKIGNGLYMCSGNLINNTSYNKENYVLSAYHCQEAGNVSAWTFYFNYQLSECGGNEGIWNQSVTGAEIIAKNSYIEGSDFLLLRITSVIPESYNVYYAGWSRTEVGNPSVGCGIHHPRGDWKKISIPSTITSSSNSSMILEGYGTLAMGKRFWMVKWSRGSIEQGSSGSGLFDGSKRIIGQLFAGNSCSASTQSGTEFYGKIATSWKGGGSPPTRLSNWLDPYNTNASFINGINWNYIPETSEYNQEKMSIIPNPTYGEIEIKVKESGYAVYNVYDMFGRCIINKNNIYLSPIGNLNLSFLSNGAYLLEIIINGNSYSNIFILRK